MSLFRSSSLRPLFFLFSFAVVSVMLVPTVANAIDLRCLLNIIRAQIQGSETTVSQTEAYKLLKEVEDDPQLPTLCPMDGCSDRAHWVAKKLEERGISSQKIFLQDMVRSRGGLTAPNPFNQNRPHSWNWHVANLISVTQKNRNTQKMVLDPWLAKRPLTISEWTSLLGQPTAAQKTGESDVLGWFVTPRFVRTARPISDYPHSWDEDEWRWIRIRLDQEVQRERRQIKGSIK